LAASASSSHLPMPIDELPGNNHVTQLPNIIPATPIGARGAPQPQLFHQRQQCSCFPPLFHVESPKIVFSCTK
jgi:hypothetical protein